MSAYAVEDASDVDMTHSGNNSASTSRHQRTLHTPATTSARFNPSAGRIASQTPILMSPPLSNRKPHQDGPRPPHPESQNGRSASNDSRLSTIHVTRPPPTTPQTIHKGEVKAALLPTPSRSHQRDTPLSAAYDKRRDPMYDPMRDPDHSMHDGCDVPLRSVEDVYARQERAWRRMQRWG